MFVTINHNIFNLKFFADSAFCKSAKFQNNGKNDPPSGSRAPPWGTIFLPEILLLVVSISYLRRWENIFKISFQNNKAESFKNLEILQCKRDFFNFLQAITFDTFTSPNWIFYICSILVILQENKESNGHR